MSISRVPIELWDHIIGYLHDDKQSLVSCRLTCRDWVRASESRIFRIVQLRHSNIQTFLGFIDTHSPQIALYVRVLRLDECQKYDSEAVELFRRLAPRLRTLKVLWLFESCLVNDNANSGIIAILHDAKNFPDLQRIRSFRSSFDSLSNLSALLVAHPNIDCVELSNSECQGASDTITDVVGPSISSASVTSSTLCSGIVRAECIETNPSIFYALLLHYPAMRPRSFRMYPIPTRDSDISLVSDLLRILGSALQDLKIGIVEDPFDTHSSSLSLASNSNLRHLTFMSVKVLVLEGVLFDPIRDLYNLLSTITSRLIETITIETIHPSEKVFLETVAKFGWSDIDTAIVGSDFPKLRKVVIKLYVLYYDWDMAGGERKLRELMPALEKRGMLKVIGCSHSS